MDILCPHNVWVLAYEGLNSSASTQTHILQGQPLTVDADELTRRRVEPCSASPYRTMKFLSEEDWQFNEGSFCFANELD